MCYLAWTPHSNLEGPRPTRRLVWGGGGKILNNTFFNNCELMR